MAGVECCWCGDRPATHEIGGREFCARCYPEGKRVVYVERADLDAAIAAHRRVKPAPVEQATAAPGEKRTTTRARKKT